jgi:NDP-sugar pyrophosphorylase family protein
MNLVICMAGRNTRFHDVGIDIPKYLLPLAGKPAIESIVENLISDDAFSNVYLVAHERDIYFKDELITALGSLSIDPKNLLYVGETNGQADTANLALSLLDIDQSVSVVFHNADTVLLDRNTEALRNTLLSGSGAIDVFSAESPSYSYVRIEGDEILEIAEKRVISNWATSGLYGFPSGTLFQKYFEKLLMSKAPLPTNELYISDVINLMLNERIRFQPLGNELEESTTTFVMGSPEEYRLIQTTSMFSNYAN